MADYHQSENITWGQDHETEVVAEHQTSSEQDGMHENGELAHTRNGERVKRGLLSCIFKLT